MLSTVEKFACDRASSSSLADQSINLQDCNDGIPCTTDSCNAETGVVPCVRVKCTTDMVCRLRLCLMQDAISCLTFGHGTVLVCTVNAHTLPPLQASA